MRKNLKYLIISLFALLVFSCGMILVSHDFSVNNNETQEEEEVEEAHAGWDWKEDTKYIYVKWTDSDEYPSSPQATVERTNLSVSNGNFSFRVRVGTGVGNASFYTYVGGSNDKDGKFRANFDIKGCYLENFIVRFKTATMGDSHEVYSLNGGWTEYAKTSGSQALDGYNYGDFWYTTKGIATFNHIADTWIDFFVRLCKYTLNFSSAGEISGNTSVTQYYSGIFAPPSTTRTGYTFNGWYYYDDDNNQSFLGNIMPILGENNTTKTAYADWTANTYNISYNLNGGTAGSNSPTTGTYASVVNISYPTREGYTFAGWTYSGGNSSTAQYSNRKGGLIFTYDIYDDWTDGTQIIKATKFKNLTPTNNATVTLTAHWVANDYNVTFYSNKPASMTSNITQTLNGDDYTSTSKTMSKFVTFDSIVSKTAKASATGWTFNGYYTSASDGQRIFDGNGNIVKNVSGYTDSNGKWKKAANTSLYAQWTANGYKPLIKPNGGIYNGSGNNLELSGITYDNAFNVLNPTREGYTFAGWTMTNGDATTALHGTSSDSLSSWSDPSTAVTSTWFNNLTPTKNATVTLTAQWTANEYNITFDANKPASMTSNITQTLNGNAYTSTPTTMSKFVTFDSSVSKTAKASATGWAFNGYYTSASGGQRIFDGNGNIVKNVSGYTDSNGNWKKAANTSLYARWAQRVYAITLNKQSGSDGTSTIYQKYDNGYYLNYANNVVSNQMTNSANPITVPTRNGYVFDGYYLNTAFNTAEQYIDCYGYLTTYAANNHFAAAGTLYAKWIGTWAQFQSFWAPTQNSSGQYQIASAADLAWFMNKVNFNNASGDTLHAIQTNNIDLSGHIWYPIGTSSSKFYGTYDGQGYKISGLETVAQVNGGVAGLFGFISNKTATSVEIETKITNVYIEGGNVNGHVSAGGVVGNIASGLVSKCLIYNTTINGGARGGIIGVAASGSKIDNSIYYNTNAISLTHNICSGSGTITDCLSKINGTETFYGKNDNNWRNVTNMFVSALPKALFWIAYTE